MISDAEQTLQDCEDRMPLSIRSLRLAAGFSLAALLLAGARPSSAESAWVRVNQAGYEAGQPARAFLMTNAPVSGITFSVKNSEGKVVASGSVGSLIGTWGHSKTVIYDVYPIDFSAPAGDTYTIAVAGAVTAKSPEFAVDAPDVLYSGFLLNTLFFYETERDGPNYIPNALRTAPGHFNDAHATVYDTPPIDDNGYVDNVPPAAPLVPAGLPKIDAAGG